MYATITEAKCIDSNLERQVAPNQVEALIENDENSIKQLIMTCN